MWAHYECVLMVQDFDEMKDVTAPRRAERRCTGNPEEETDLKDREEKSVERAKVKQRPQVPEEKKTTTSKEKNMLKDKNKPVKAHEVKVPCQACLALNEIWNKDCVACGATLATSVAEELGEESPDEVMSTSSSPEAQMRALTKILGPKLGMPTRKAELETVAEILGKDITGLNCKAATAFLRTRVQKLFREDKDEPTPQLPLTGAMSSSVLMTPSRTAVKPQTRMSKNPTPMNSHQVALTKARCRFGRGVKLMASYRERGATQLLKDSLERWAWLVWRKRTANDWEKLGRILKDLKQDRVAVKRPDSHPVVTKQRQY